MSSESVRIAVNGEDVEVPAGAAVLDVLVSRGYDPARVAVEIDGAICPRGEVPSRRIRGGERMEVVSFVGGG